MAGFTDRGAYKIMEAYFQGANVPTAFKVALVTAATAPSAATNVLSDLTEIAAGNGYTAGGMTVARSSSGFDVLTEQDSPNYKAFVQAADITWTASGGPIPASGNGARYAVLLDSASPANIIGYWDLGSARQVSDTQDLKLIDCQFEFLCNA
jgi:hypothetical protein